MIRGRRALIPLKTARGYEHLIYDPQGDRFEYDGWGVSRRYLLECYREIRRGPADHFMPAPGSISINFGPRLTLYPAHCRQILDIAGRFRRYIPRKHR